MRAPKVEEAAVHYEIKLRELTGTEDNFTCPVLVLCRVDRDRDLRKLCSTSLNELHPKKAGLLSR